MKKFVQSNIRGGFAAAVIGAGLLVSANSVKAAPVTTDSDTLTIQGSVEVFTSIAVATDAAANFGTIEYNAGVAKVSVATVTELCNKEDGYDVTIQSANRAGGAANIKNASDDLIPYSVYYNGNEVAVDMTGPDAVNITNASLPTDSDGVDKGVEISIASGYKISGDYSDILTFTIAAK